jgi:hypothetical protein
MLIKVTRLEVVPPYKLAVEFSDGTRGVHDCAAIVAEGTGVIAPLRDPSFFRQAFLDHGAPTWPNSFDMDPEWLQREMVEAGELKQPVGAE